MSHRLELQHELEAILGSKFVYFQPPESIKICYPCIVYSLDGVDTKHADDKPYRITKRYSVTIIDKDPDSIIPDKLLALPMCSPPRFYTADNLNHWVFSLFYEGGSLND